MENREFLVDVGDTNYFCRVVKVSDSLVSFQLFDGDRAETNIDILKEAEKSVLEKFKE